MRTQPPLKQLQIETITEHHFSVGMWIKSGTHTGSMYDTYRIYYNIVYMYRSSAWIIGKRGLRLSLSHSLFCIPFTALLKCWWARTDSSPIPWRACCHVGRSNTLRWRCCLFLGLGPRAYAAVAVRGEHVRSLRTAEKPKLKRALLCYKSISFFCLARTVQAVEEVRRYLLLKLRK